MMQGRGMGYHKHDISRSLNILPFIWGLVVLLFWLSVFHSSDCLFSMISDLSVFSFFVTFPLAFHYVCIFWFLFPSFVSPPPMSSAIKLSAYYMGDNVLAVIDFSVASLRKIPWWRVPHSSPWLRLAVAPAPGRVEVWPGKCLICHQLTCIVVSWDQSRGELRWC